MYYSINVERFLKYYSERILRLIGDDYSVASSIDKEHTGVLKFTIGKKDSYVGYDYRYNPPKPKTGSKNVGYCVINAEAVPGLCGGLFFYLTAAYSRGTSSAEIKQLQDLMFEAKETLARAESRNGIYYVVADYQGPIMTALERNGWTRRGKFNNWNTDNDCYTYTKELERVDEDGCNFPGYEDFRKSTFEAKLPGWGFTVHEKRTRKKAKKKRVRKANS